MIGLKFGEDQIDRQIEGNLNEDRVGKVDR